MNKIKIVKQLFTQILQDCIVVGKGIGIIIGCIMALNYTIYTVGLGIIWLANSQGWVTAWEPWAISLAPYWTIGNLILAFVSWIGYRIYQAIKIA